MSDPIVALAARLRESPAFFARSMVGYSPLDVPSDEQLAMYRAVARPRARVTVRAGRGTSKSTGASVLAAWFICMYPQAEVFCLASTFPALTAGLVKNCERVCSTLKYPELTGRIKLGKRYITNTSTKGVIQFRSAARGNEMSLRSAHGKHFLLIIDEASDVSDAAFENLVGGLTDDDNRILLLSNPAHLSGFFFDSHNTNEEWERLHFDSRSCKHVNLEQLRKALSVDPDDITSNTSRVHVMGEFPLSEEDTLIRREWVERAFVNQTSSNDVGADIPAVLGCDPSYGGGDNAVIFYRKGNFAEPLWERRKFSGELLPGRVMADEIARICAERDIYRVYIDMTGIGTACYEAAKANLGGVVTGISFGSGAYNKAQYANLPAEIWFRMCDWFRADGSVLGSTRWDDQVKRELSSRNYSTNNYGKLQLEGKADIIKRLGEGSSPGFGDALALTFCCRDEDILAYRHSLQIKRQPSRLNLTGYRGGAPRDKLGVR